MAASVEKNDSELIADRVFKIIDQYFEDHGNPILFSKLGETIISEDRTFIKENFPSLNQFLHAFLDKKVSIAKIPRKGFAAFPTQKELEISFGDTSVTDWQIRPPRMPSYYNYIWRAFSAPIEKEKRRYVDVEQVPPDVQESESPPPGGNNVHEILETDLPTPIQNGLRASPQEIHEAIATWAEGKFDPKKLERTAQFPPSRSYKQKSPAQRGSESRSFATEIFGHFSDDELRRINIPADILLSVVKRIVDE